MRAKMGLVGVDGRFCVRFRAVEKDLPHAFCRAASPGRADRRVHMDTADHYFPDPSSRPDPFHGIFSGSGFNDPVQAYQAVLCWNGFGGGLSFRR